MWRIGLAVLLLVAVPGCLSPGGGIAPGDDGASSSTDRAGNVTHLGTFNQGFVYFAFQATGPDHEVRAAYANRSYASYAYIGSIEAYAKDSFRPRSVGALSGSNRHVLSARGDALPTVEQIDVEGQAQGEGAHSVWLKPESWNKTWWIAYGAASPDGGPAEINLSIKGSDFRIVQVPREGPGRGFRSDEWTGALDARVGHGDAGAGVTLERELRFETAAGTYLAYSLGVASSRVDSVILSNSTSSATWTGVMDFRTGTHVSTPGSNDNLAGFLVLASPPEEWTLTVRESLHSGSIPDYVFVADLDLPPDFYMLM